MLVAVSGNRQRVLRPGRPDKALSRVAKSHIRNYDLENAAFSRHDFAMKSKVQLDRSNRIVLSKDLRRAAGFGPGQKLKASAGPGRIVLEVESNSTGIRQKNKATR